MKLAFILIISLFLLVKPIEAMVTWSENQETVASGSRYTPGRSYGFQITWTADGSHTVKNIILESNFSTLNENLANDSITFTENGTVTVTKTFVDLSGGRYLYKWYASDNESNWTSSDQVAYTLNPNNSITINLYLNGTEANRSYNLNDIANFTVFLNIPNKLVYLDSNYVGFIQQSSSTSLINYFTSLSSPGVFTATAHWDGDANYSSSSKTYYFDNIPPQFSVRSEYPINPPDYSLNVIYSFGMIWSDITLSHVWFESNFSGTFKNYTYNTTPAVQNTLNSFYISVLSLPAETFVYRWIANDSANSVRNTTQYVYTILKRYPLTIQTIPSTNVPKGIKTILICNSITDEVPASNFKFYRNNTLIENSTLFVRRDEQFLNEGAYEYICNNTETQNFTAQTSKVILNIGFSNVTVPATPQTLNLTGPSSIQLSIGESHESNFFLENYLGQTINNLSLSITGIDTSWYNISEWPNSIPNNFSLRIKVNLNTPSDAQQGIYNLTLRAWCTTNETKVATKTITLTISAAPPPEIFPPIYLIDTANVTSHGNIYEFALKWNDEIDLSGYIFSSNITGEWINDSWVPCPGKECWSYSSKNITIQPQAMIGWKFYANDSNNLWTESEEFYLQAKKEGTDITLSIVIVSVFVICLAVVLLFITKRKKPKAQKKENVVYVYRKEDLK